MAEVDIERLKLELDAKRLELDSEIRRSEINDKKAQRDIDFQLKNRELEITAGRGLRFTSGQATVAAALLALISGGLGGVMQAWSSRDIEAGKSKALIELETIKVNGNLAQDKQKLEAGERLDREKFETTLILRAIDTPNRDNQVKNLQFFIEAGFIKDPEGKIKRIRVEDFPTPTAPAKPVQSSAELKLFDSKLVELLTEFESEPPDSSVLTTIQKQLADLVVVPLNENQRSALTAFIYNMGISVFRTSSLMDKLNRNDFRGAADEFKKWNKVAGRELRGLTLRRQKEAELFKTAPENSPN